MMKLLRIESLKVLPYRVFQILGVLYVGSFLISIIILPNIKLETSMTNNQDILNFKSLYMFPEIWDTWAYLAAKSNIFLAIILIFLVGNEFSYNMFRQQVINGLSRTELLNGKLLVIGGIALANTLIIFVFGLIFGFIYSTGYTFHDVVSHLYMLGVYFIQAVAQMLFALMLAIWLRNKTLATVVLLLYQVVIEMIIRLIVNKYIWAKLGLFFPIRVIARLSPLPDMAITEFLKTNSDLQDFTQSLPLWANLLLAVGYGTIFYMVSLGILKKRNL